MDAKEELEKAKAKRQELVDRINMLTQEVARFEAQKQELLQEVLVKQTGSSDKRGASPLSNFSPQIAISPQRLYNEMAWIGMFGKGMN